MTATDAPVGLHAEVTLRETRRDKVMVTPVTGSTPNTWIRHAARLAAPDLASVIHTDVTRYPGSRSAVVTFWKD